MAGKEKLLTEQEREKQLLELTDVIKTFPFSTLVRIGHAMNENEWPEELPGKPDGWDEMSINERSEWSMSLYQYIRARVGYKAMLRYYHKTELGKTDQEFEDWWESCSMHSGHNAFNECQNQRYCGDTERYKSSESKEFIVPFFLGANVGVFFVTLLTYVLKISGVL